LAWLYPVQNIYPIACNKNQHMSLIYYHNQTILIDPGYLANQSLSWIQYTLPSEIITHTGIPTLHHVIVLQPSLRIFNTIQTLALQISIQYLYMPKLQTKSASIVHAYQQLEDFCNQRGILLSYVDTEQLPIIFDQHHSITLMSKSLRTHAMLYRSMHAIVNIDTLQTTIYAAKQKNKGKEFL
jgi:hypothetical protein